jgi:hypothetical protein
LRHRQVRHRLRLFADLIHHDVADDADHFSHLHVAEKVESLA